MYVYEFIKNILKNEYTNISVMNEIQVVKNKELKVRKINVNMTMSYYDDVSK